MEFCRKTILLLIFSSFMSVGWGQDTTPPELIDFSISTNEVDVTDGDQSVVVSFIGLDDISGVSSFQSVWVSPNGMSNEGYCSNSDGDLELECSGTMNFEQYSDDGVWLISQINIHDIIGNGRIYYIDELEEMGFETEINVISGESLCDEEIEVELWGECYNIEETTSLNLSSSGLTGEIPSSIGELTSLTYLNLSSNQLTGEIPPEIGNLTNLIHLYLFINQLTGEIPSWIGNLTNLEMLWLNNNQLTGEIPEIIGDLSSVLWNLNLGYNQLTGEIPVEIGNLTNLQELSLYNNQLSGQVPESICNLNQCYDHFHIGDNQLCPPYPDCLTEEDVGYQDTSECGEPSLCDEGYTEIDGECYFQGDLDVLQQFIDNSQEGDNPPPSDLSPIELGDQEWEDGRLVEFTGDGEFSSFYISGEIPSNIGNLIELRKLILIQNDQLTGFIPNEIGDLVDLTDLWLYSNQLTGEIPSEIWNLTNLTHLELGDNQLTGEIPVDIGNLTNLGLLHLGYNQFIGEIPVEIGQLTNLTRLYLQNNELTGEIPLEIGNLTNLTRLYLQNNELTGEIPLEIGNLTNLTRLYLNNNQLTGEITPEIGNLMNLTRLYLQNNELTGEIPSEICNQGDNSPSLTNNQLCPPYPECLSEEDIGTQDTSECEEECILGDINNDSILNVQDIVSLVTLILEVEYNECGDVNSDGILNVIDVVILVNIILSIP